MDDNDALRKLREDDEAGAREALDHLFRRFAPQLERYLRYKLGEQEANAQDIVQQVFGKIWSRRSQFEFVDAARWHRFLQVVAANTRKDILRATSSTEELDPERGPGPDNACDSVINPIVEAAELRLVKRVADTLWLGLDPRESDDERNQRLLAAQLYYLRGAGFDQTLRLALGETETSASTGRCRLECILADPATVCSLTARYLTMSPDRVVATILCPGAPPDQDTLNRITKRAMTTSNLEQRSEAIGGWTWREVKAILIRHRLARSSRSVISSQYGDISAEELDAINVRINKRLPFESRMNRLLDGFERTPSPDMKALRSAGFWRRLVFEYRYICELPQKEIVTWLEPAAKAVGYNGVTEANVNALVSAHRLMDDLSKACRRALGDERDE